MDKNLIQPATACQACKSTNLVEDHHYKMYPRKKRAIVTFDIKCRDCGNLVFGISRLETDTYVSSATDGDRGNHAI